MDDYRFEEFTETGYARFLELAKKNYEFCLFNEHKNTPHILLRHDIDFSAHRALKIAQIEKEHEVRSTYLFCPNDALYNMFSPQVLDIIAKIKDLGHDIGIHFDATILKSPFTEHTLHKQIQALKDYFETVTDIQANVLSFHLYAAFEELMPKTDSVANMINAYSDSIKERYKYVSDSNGIWRFQNLFDVVEKAEHSQLHILTHPIWWTPETQSPRNRISRAIDGYARFMSTYYDELIASFNRPNIK